MADDQINVQITATDDGLKAGLDEAKAAVEQLPEGMKAAQGAADDFSDTLKRVGEVAAGVFGGLQIEEFASKIKEAFNEAIFGTAEWAETLEHASLTLGAGHADGDAGLSQDGRRYRALDREERDQGFTARRQGRFVRRGALRQGGRRRRPGGHRRVNFRRAGGDRGGQQAFR